MDIDHSRGHPKGLPLNGTVGIGTAITYAKHSVRGDHADGSTKILKAPERCLNGLGREVF
jgi:hypothetical protein